MDSGLTDEALMLKYREGDARAFEQLYTRHRGGLYRYFLRLCRDAGTAEDLYQGVWMKVIAARERYEVKAKFTTWLYQMAHNHFVDHYRKQSASRGSGQNMDEEALENIADDPGQQPEQQVEAAEQAAKLRELIKQLPDEQREAFLLREESGLSIAEIAEVTGVNVETAKSRLRYAVNRLRKSMHDE